MFQDKTTREFQCEYCPRSFSRLSAYRNHLRTHCDQMFLNETGLSREESNTGSLQESNTLQEYNHFIESLNNEQVKLNDCQQENIYKVGFSINFDIYKK